jgi:hypothetical protein
MGSCRILGHRPRFWAEGEVMHWECERECDMKGSKRYGSPEEAAHFAAAFDREDRDDIGRRPLLSLLPMALARRLASRGSGTKG